MKIQFYWCLLSAGILMAGCGNDDKKPVTKAAPKKPVVQAPFRYQKHLEVSPGNSFDILSWGRGSTQIGAFLILHSDSAGMEYTTTTGDLEGTITDVYNADMDQDGNPEILITANAADTVHFTNVYPFEFNGSQARKLDFPKLTRKQAKGYRGKDNFYIKEGKFIREFPIFEGEGSAAKPGIARRVLEYGLRGNSFTVDQLSKDSTDKEDVVATNNNQPQQVSRQSSVSKSSKKKKSSSSKRSRKRRRHRG
jgi:hypothetical protein